MPVSYFQELGELYFLAYDVENYDIDTKEHLINAVLNNSRIIDQSLFRSLLQ